MKHPELEALAARIRTKVEEMNAFLPKRQAVWEELQRLQSEAGEKGLRFSFHFPVSSNRVGDEISIGRLSEND